MTCRLTNRWSGRVKDKVPSSDAGVRAAQLSRYALRFVPVIFILSGCTATPATFSANQSCDLPSSVWREIQSPPERESLLDLPEKGSGTPVRTHFKASSVQREAWFEDSSHNLQACLYNPMMRRSC